MVGHFIILDCWIWKLLSFALLLFQVSVALSICLLLLRYASANMASEREIGEEAVVLTYLMNYVNNCRLTDTLKQITSVHLSCCTAASSQVLHDVLCACYDQLAIRNSFSACNGLVPYCSSDTAMFISNYLLRVERLKVCTRHRVSQ